MPRPAHRTLELLHWIERYIQRYGESPSYREMADGMGWVSTSTAYDVCRRLMAQGLLRKGKRRHVKLP